jgi:hypothetical protein
VTAFLPDYCRAINAALYEGWQYSQSIKILAFHHPIPQVIIDLHLYRPFNAVCIALLYKSFADF